MRKRSILFEPIATQKGPELTRFLDVLVDGDGKVRGQRPVSQSTGPLTSPPSDIAEAEQQPPSQC